MASENPDDKKDLDPTRDGPKKPRKLYKGVYENKSTGKWYAQFWTGTGNTCIGTFETELEAALAYDKTAKEFNCAEKRLNFPELRTDNSSSPATESTLPVSTGSASGVQISVTSGSSSANVGKGKQRKQITICQSEIDAALPYHEAKKKEFEAKIKEFEDKKKEFPKAIQNDPQHHTTDDSSPATTSTLLIPTSTVTGVAIGSEVHPPGSIYGSSGSTAVAVAEPQAAAEVVILPTATNSTLPRGTSSVSEVAIGSELATFLREQPLANSVCSAVRATGSIIGSSGSTIIAVTEPQDAAAEVISPTATNSTLPVAASPVGGVASRSESANIPSGQPAVMESVVNPGVEALNFSAAEIEFADSFLDQEAIEKDFKSS